jgi:hypothetical protein
MELAADGFTALITEFGIIGSFGMIHPQLFVAPFF